MSRPLQGRRPSGFQVFVEVPTLAAVLKARSQSGSDATTPSTSPNAVRRRVEQPKLLPLQSSNAFNTSRKRSREEHDVSIDEQPKKRRTEVSHPIT